jgi:hypothetical protein
MNSKNLKYPGCLLIFSLLLISALQGCQQSQTASSKPIFCVDFRVGNALDEESRLLGTAESFTNEVQIYAAAPVSNACGDGEYLNWYWLKENNHIKSGRTFVPVGTSTVNQQLSASDISSSALYIPSGSYQVKVTVDSKTIAQEYFSVSVEAGILR